MNPTSAPTTDNPADPIISSLTTSDVYVAPTLTSAVDVTRLQEASRDYSHTTVKMALLTALPPAWLNDPRQQNMGPDAARDVFAQRIHDELNLTNDALVLMVAQGPGAGVSISAGTLSRDEENAIASKYVGRLQIGQYQVLPEMATKIASKIDAKERFLPDIALTLFLIVVIVVIVVLVKRSKAKREQMERLRAPIEAGLKSFI